MQSLATSVICLFVHYYTYNLTAIVIRKKQHIQLCRHAGRLKKYHYQIYRHNTRDGKIHHYHYVDITQSVHASSVDVFINKFFSSHSVSCGLVNIALAKLRHSRSVWGSLSNTYLQSLLYLTCRRMLVTTCTVLKRDDPCCGNSLWNGLPMGFEFTIGRSMHLPMGFVFYFV